jgi:hypothetical protein
MFKIEATRHQVAIAGSVTDAKTGRAIAGAVVILKSAAQVVIACEATGADGHFHFLDLADGQYALAATLEAAGTRYGKATKMATVARDGGRIKLATADMVLPPTTVKGAITGSGAAPVSLAEVRVQGSGERTFSDTDGHYLLTGLEVGSRILLVSARGYDPARAAAVLAEAGAEYVVDVTLVPKP